MKIIIKTVLLLAASLFAGTSLLSQIPEGLPVTRLPVTQDGSLLVDDFQNERPGTLPSKWFNREGEGVPAVYAGANQDRYHYSVMEEAENRFLRFDGTRGVHLNFPLREAENFSLRDHPVLSWSWRAHELPPRAREDQESRNDVAASIYVVYSVNWLRVPRVIRYTWSSTLPAGREVSMNFNRMKVVVVESGPAKVGQWVHFERNIYEDYRRLFGGRPPDRPLAILILSDGRSTGNPVMADYDNIKLKTGR